MNKKVIKFLRGISHNIKPVVMVADKGLTENVMHEINNALELHELVKIKLRVDRETRSNFEKEILELTGAEKIHSIGQTLTIFLANPDDPQFDLTL
jgi:RNA-binding protein